MNNVSLLMTMVSCLTNMLKETDLIVKVNTLSWKSFRKAGQCSDVLVGSCNVHDIV